jgi:hypothetical protein
MSDNTIVRYENPIFKYFVSIPKIALSELKRDEYMLYAYYIDRCHWQNTRAFQIGKRLIAEDIDIAACAVTDIRQRLQYKGYIQVEEPNTDGRPNEAPIVTLLTDVWNRNWEKYADDAQRNQVAIRLMRQAVETDDAKQMLLNEKPEVILELAAMLLGVDLNDLQQGMVSIQTTGGLNPDQGGLNPDQVWSQSRPPIRKEISKEEKPLVADATGGVPTALTRNQNYHPVAVIPEQQTATLKAKKQTADDIQGHSELIMYLYSMNTDQMTKKQVKKLATNHIFVKDDTNTRYGSPNHLYVTDPRFKDYVDDMLKACRAMHGGSIVWNTLIGLICNFDREGRTLGWGEWKKLVPLANGDKPTIKQEREIPYVDVELEIPDNMQH